jgi:hypothetical protein
MSYVCNKTDTKISVPWAEFRSTRAKVNFPASLAYGFIRGFAMGKLSERCSLPLFFIRGSSL